MASAQVQRPAPASFCCPISRQCMHDPVVLADGHSYERRHIEEWLQMHNTSPISGLQLQLKDVTPNHALRNAIQEYFQMLFDVQHNAIWETMQESPENASNARWKSDEALMRTIDALVQSSLLMSADLDIESMLKQIMQQAKTLLRAEVASVFLVDVERQQLYSTVNSTGGELRIPISQGIAGHVATTGKPLIIFDAYSDSRFDKSMDVRTGFRTGSIICVPLKSKSDNTLGVVQLINKIGKDSNVDGDAYESSSEFAFTANDLHFLQVFASQVTSAIVGSGLIGNSLVAGGSEQQHPEPHDLASTEICDDDHLEKESEKEPLIGLDESSVASLLKEASSEWRFDALRLSEVTFGNPLTSLACHLFESAGLVDHFGLDYNMMRNYFIEIERIYGSNSYHNSTHASSVLHLTHAMMTLGGLLDKVVPALDMERQLVLMACLLAAAVHDTDHPGVSNDYLVNTSSSRALRYNDRSVNEQHHAAVAFDVLARPECNFLKVLDPPQFRKMRKLVIDLIVGTDMAKHGETLKLFKEFVNESSSDSEDTGITPCDEKNAVLMLQVGLKCADLGHLTLDWDDHVDWVELLEDEFFSQGDLEKERGMQVSFLMDREKPGASQTQVGFFDFVVLPLFRTFVAAVPGAAPLLKGVLENYTRWKEAGTQVLVGRTKSVGGTPTKATVEDMRNFSNIAVYESPQARRRTSSCV